MNALSLALLLTVGQADANPPVEVSPNPTQYQPVTLTFTGPEANETGEPNPFRDYRLRVRFSHRAETPRTPLEEWAILTVDGYFAADGNAAESGATAGDKWRVHFLPESAGTWYYEVTFVAGKDVAIHDAPTLPSERMPLDGLKGSFTVAEADPNAPGFSATGPLEGTWTVNTGRYLRFMASNRPFLKAGADSPENLLAYADFDGTRALGGPQPKREGESSRAGLHTYEPHVGDWEEGDPTWRGGKGKGLIGALNYLASQGVNSVYFLPMNVEGDGQDVWPWIDPDTRDRFDVSKLDQWGIAFDHAAKLGIVLHVVLTETENENLFEALDGPSEPGASATGDEPEADVPFADTRKLYYRELIARFGHHPAVVWNLGEENGGDGKDGSAFARGNTTEQRKAFAAFLKDLDPYGHPVVVHTYPGQYDKVYEPLLGFPHLDGPSLQMGDPKQAHAETLKWLRKSKEAGRPWFVCVDEIGPADTGVVPDSDPNAAANHKLAREVLWGNLLAGGSGVEWYFGYKYPHNDLNCEDFRSREKVWEFTKAAIDFFHAHLPFDEMESADELVKADGTFCLAKPGEVYAVYLPTAETPVETTLPAGTYDVLWFDPIAGGELKPGSVAQTEGGDRASLGEPPGETDRDWVVLVRRQEARGLRE
ncbi:MAG TPA: DUF5060 domain-containing protein [Planctomycetaceae bacterium]